MNRLPVIGAMVCGLGLGLITAGAQQAAPSPEVVRMQAQLQDWPNLERYRAENAALGAPKAGERRVVFIGDSITDGWGRGQGKFFPDKPYVNRGISGQTTPQMVLRFQQDVVQLKPEAVVILAGINDIAGNTGHSSLEMIEDNFRSMVAIAKAEHIRVVLCSVLPADRFPWRAGIQPAGLVRDLNKWLEDFARTQGAVYVNYYPAMVNEVGGMREELAADSVVHPNTAGYAVMEPLAAAGIAKALALPRP
jgi:lysophospholipase L1-like esterase